MHKKSSAYLLTYLLCPGLNKVNAAFHTFADFRNVGKEELRVSVCVWYFTIGRVGRRRQFVGWTGEKLANNRTFFDVHIIDWYSFRLRKQKHYKFIMSTATLFVSRAEMAADSRLPLNLPLLPRTSLRTSAVLLIEEWMSVFFRH